MTNLPPDDEKLVKFLRQYRPVPPPASPSAEERLTIALLNSERQVQQISYSFRWAIPAVVAASALLVWGGFRFFQPVPQVQIVDRTQENTDIEEFMLSSWNSAIEGTNSIAYNESSESTWPLLGELDSNSDSANHQ